MLRRQTQGSVICTSCGVLVGVNDDKCYNCGRRNPGLWGFAPALRSLGTDLGFVPFVIGTCIVLFGIQLTLSIAISGRVGMNGLFGLLAPSLPVNRLLGASGAVPVFVNGFWWTILSAGWLHGSLLHIVFNMYALRQLAPAAAELYGPGRMTIIYVLSSAVGFALSSFAGAFIPPLFILSGATVTVGASASIAGLIGAILYYGHRSGSSMARSYATTYIVMLAVIGFAGSVDNYAHAGGLGGGYFIARILDPLKPERVDHIVIAVACLAASLLAVLASAVIVLPLLLRS